MFVVAHAEGGQGGGRVFLFTRQDNNLCPFGAQGVLWTRAQVMQCRAGSSLFLFLMVTSRFFLGSSQVGLGIGRQCRIIALLESLPAVLQMCSYYWPPAAEDATSEWRRLEFSLQFFWFQSIEIFLLLRIWLFEVGKLWWLFTSSFCSAHRRGCELKLSGSKWGTASEVGFLGSTDSSGTSHLSSQRLFSHLWNNCEVSSSNVIKKHRVIEF